MLYYRFDSLFFRDSETFTFYADTHKHRRAHLYLFEHLIHLRKFITKIMRILFCGYRKGKLKVSIDTGFPIISIFLSNGRSYVKCQNSLCELHD